MEADQLFFPGFEAAPKPKRTLAQIEMELSDLIQATIDTLELIDNEVEAEEFKARMDKMITDMRGEEACKIDAYGILLSKCEAEEIRLAGLAAALTERKRRLANRAERIKNHLLYTMHTIGVKKIEGEVFTAKFRTMESVEITGNIDDMPEAYVKITKEPKKAELKDALKNHLITEAEAKARIKKSTAVSVSAR